MNHRSAASRFLPGSIVIVWLAIAGRASGEGTRPPDSPSSPPPSIPTEQPPSPEEKALTDRRQAEALYASAWGDVEKARSEAAESESLAAKADPKSADKGKKKSESAGKRLRKAADRFEQATRLSPDYHEAWNMLGYCYRKLGDQQKAFEAYWTCLRLKPDFPPAHEYLGEAYLLAGNLPKAKAELAWLKERQAPEAAGLEKSIAAYEKEHPQPPPAPVSSGG